MSSVGTNWTTQQFYLDRFSSKRKLEAYDSSVSRIRKNSSNCWGKSVVDADVSPLIEDGFLARCDTSQSNWDLTGWQLQFFVKLISGGKTLVLRGNWDDTVELVLEKIEVITSIPKTEQRLVYRGKHLHWDHTLRQCQIENDASLQLVGKMRSTGHPQVWRVITDMVSNVYRIYRKELAFVDKLVVDDFCFLFKKPYKKSRIDDGMDDKHWKKIKKKIINIGKVDFCKIFMDANAAHGIIMLYVSNETYNRTCGKECIEGFINFMRDLKGCENDSDRAYCVTTVLKFCKVLKMMVSEEDSLYLYCRSKLGSMLEEVVVGSGQEGSYDHAGTEGKMNRVAIGDMFPFLWDVGKKLICYLSLSVEPGFIAESLDQVVCDFSSFLQPVLRFTARKLAAASNARSGKGTASLFLPNEIQYLFDLLKDLLYNIDKCLNKLELDLVESKKNVEANESFTSKYLAILKELYGISVLYPGFEDQFLNTMRRYKRSVCELVVRYAKPFDDNSWLLNHKDVLNYASRRHLAMLLFPDASEDYEELHEMLIDRSSFLAESFEYISRAEPSSLHSGLFVEFKNEEATGPGVLREWFSLVCLAIFDPQRALFVACPFDPRRFYPNRASSVHPLHLPYFRFSGRVIALALMHKIQVGVSLDRIFFLQLAGRRVTMEDIRDADPCIYISCKQILDMDAEFVDSDALALTFATEIVDLGTRKVVELCPQGKDIAVNSKNRKEYVNLIVQHHFVTSIAEQVSCFAQGFADILCERIHGEIFFECLELEDLDSMLRGSETEISVKDWKSHTNYNGYKESDPQIVWFWEVVGELSAEQKRTLLSFWTSLKYLPIEGFCGLASRLYIYKTLVPQDHLPSSHTCFYRLCIPPYPSEAVMRERLLVITREHVGCSFGTW
ncbi:unnamed protein product [Amaranthus hypochondriacus]